MYVLIAKIIRISHAIYLHHLIIIIIRQLIRRRNMSIKSLQGRLSYVQDIQDYISFFGFLILYTVCISCFPEIKKYIKLKQNLGF